MRPDVAEHCPGNASPAADNTNAPMIRHRIEHQWMLRGKERTHRNYLTLVGVARENFIAAILTKGAEADRDAPIESEFRGQRE